MSAKACNDTKQYVNQYYDVIDLPETIDREPTITCNVSCISMITGENVNDVLKHFIDKYTAKSKKFQWQELLIEYLEKNGYLCKPVLKRAAWPSARNISDDEISSIIDELKFGNIIFYHKYGHYQLLVGYEIEDKKNKIEFIFNDPAGDRKLNIKERLRDSGHLVRYPYKMIKDEKIYGMCYSVKI